MAIFMKRPTPAQQLGAGNGTDARGTGEGGPMILAVLQPAACTKILRVDRIRRARGIEGRGSTILTQFFRDGRHFLVTEKNALWTALPESFDVK